MENEIRAKDYIKTDEREHRAKQDVKRDAVTMMEEHRGVNHTNSGKISISTRTFADYILAYRIDLKRLDSGIRLIKNQQTHAYEEVSDVTLKTVCMEIMDECDDSYYEFVREDSLLGYIDKQAMSYRHLDMDCRYILFPNGIYDTRTFSFDCEYKTDIVSTYVMEYRYNKNAVCVEWKKALKKMFPEDQQAVIAVVQEMFGYLFAYGEAPADTVFYLWGRGRNGKSIVDFVIRKLHGENNVAGIPLSGLSDRFNLSAVYDKKVCLCPENAQEKILDTSTLKALTGRDSIKVEKKYETPFSAVLTTKIVVNSNHYLQTDDDSVGFWERILPIPFLVTFLPKDEWRNKSDKKLFQVRDTNLEKKLEKEIAGIFNWSMEGLERLRRNNWVFTWSRSVNNLKDTMMQYSKPVLTFVKKCVKQGNFNKKDGKKDCVQSSAVQRKFQEWAEDNNVEVDKYKNARIFRKAFLESLEEQGIIVEIKKRSVDYYVGIIVKESNHIGT